MNNKGLSDKKLLVISPHFITFVREQVLEISKYFNHVDVIVPLPFVPEFMRRWSIIGRYLPGYDLLNRGGLPPNIKIHEVNYYTLPLDTFRRRKGDLAFKRVDKFIQNKEIKFDLIHAHFTYPFGYIGVKLKEKSGKRLVITAHGYDIYGLPFTNKYWENKIAYTLNNADRVITVSKSNLDCIQKLKTSTNTKIIPNGYDSNLFKPMDKAECRNKVGLSSDKKVILTVGNLVKIKGHKYLIEAMKEIVKKRRDVLCLIIGSGNLKTRLENQIKKLEMAEFVKLLGGIPHNEIAFWMNACDLFVLPSLSESFGVVQVEAMACGKPIVATYNGGSEEIITSEDYGYLVETGNPERLAEKILLALDKNWNEEYILDYAKQFAWEKITKEIIGVYKEVMKDET